MKQITCFVCMILALAMGVNAAMPVSNLSEVALEQMGLNTPPEAVGPPYAPPAPSIENISWVQLPDAAYTINRAACGKIGDYIYIFGGQGSGGGAMHIAFNITSQTWATSTAPGVSGSNWSSAVANGSLYLFPPSFANGEVQVFTPTSGGPTGTWSLATLYPNGLCAQAVAWDGGNYIYSAGGTSMSIPFTNALYRLNLTNYTFDSLAALPDARAWCGGAFVNGKFYVLGGDNTSYQYTNTCYEYNPTTNTWVTKAPLILYSAFNDFNTVTDGQKIYLVGGGGGNATTLPSTDTVQVYDPALDQWSIETPRMNNYGTNSAAYVPEGNWLFDCGGRIMTVSYNDAWRGNLSAGGPALEVTLTPHNPPIVIPRHGSSFQYDVSIHNTSANPVTFDGWIMNHWPNGTTYTILVRQNLVIPSGVTINRANLTQNIPGSAPAGTYLYVANVGTFPINVMDADTIVFTKAGVDLSAGGNWDLLGWDDPQSAVTTPYGFGLISVSPNPFNPTTTIELNLPTTSRVSLQVFDVNGRVVATLVNGWREAGSQQVTFDGSALSSGVYFYTLTAGTNLATGKMLLLK